MPIPSDNFIRSVPYQPTDNNVIILLPWCISYQWPTFTSDKQRNTVDKIYFCGNGKIMPKKTERKWHDDLKHLALEPSRKYRRRHAELEPATIFIPVFRKLLHNFELGNQFCVSFQGLKPWKGFPGPKSRKFKKMLYCANSLAQYETSDKLRSVFRLNNFVLIKKK